MIKRLSFLTLTIASLLFITQSPLANEGIIQMESNDGGRCFIFSNLLSDFKYDLSLACRGQQYPPGPGLFQYVIWADHGDGDYTNVGTVGLGKRSLVAEKPFNRLVVTKEADGEPEEPSDNIYMVGTPQVVAFLNDGRGIDVAETSTLESETKPDPTPETNTQVIPGDDTDTTEPANIGGAIRVLAVIVVVVIVVIIAIAFISASRRRPIDI